ncbi:MAG: hypothetical protein LBJ94_00525 [Puniceicoccales bacterium]|jgi:hypothetical protein|nr:hypothetical protein [Puniceicoccales bacterium]
MSDRIPGAVRLAIPNLDLDPNLDLRDAMKRHQANGNCLLYALYEACGYDETLGEKKDSNIDIRTLKGRIFERQFSGLVSSYIDLNVLLDVVRDEFNSGRLKLSASKSVGHIVFLKDKVVRNIRAAYDSKFPKGDPRAIKVNDNGLPGKQEKVIIASLIEMVDAERNPNSFMESKQLECVAQILNRQILLINADAQIVGANYKSENNNPGEIHDFTLYKEDGSMRTYPISAQGQIFDKATGEAPEFPKGTIVIAKSPTHFYGNPSFVENGLRVAGSSEPVRNFQELGIKIQESPRKAPEAAPKAKVQESPRKAPEVAPEAKVQESPRKAPEAAPEAKVQESPRKAPEAAPEAKVQESSPKAPEAAPEAKVQESPRKAPEAAPKAEVQESSPKAPEAAPEVEEVHSLWNDFASKLIEFISKSVEFISKWYDIVAPIIIALLPLVIILVKLI